MKKLKVITLDKYTDSMVRSLHEASIVQIQDISERIQQDAEWKQILKSSHVSPQTGKIASLLMKTTGTVDFLKSVRRREKGILPLLKGFINPPPIQKKEVAHLDVQELIKKAEETLDEIESKTKPREAKINELDTKISKHENASKVAKNLINFDVNLADLEDSKYISVIAGKIASDSYSQLTKSLEDLTDEIIVFSQDSEDKISKLVIIIALKQYGNEISSLLRKMEFEKFEISGLEGKPSEIIQKSETEIESLKNEKESILNDLATVAEEWLDEAIALKEQLELEKQKAEILSSFGKTEKAVMFEGWVTEKKLEKALEIIESSTDGHSIYEVSDPDVEKDDIPVHLDNPRFAKPYEMFVHMYSPPDYREFDPTILMAIVFPFFFGFCLTESGYGIADALIGLVIFAGLGKASKLMRDFGLILTACGVWAIIMGGITNSFIGDFIPRFIWHNTSAMIPTTIPAVNSFVHPDNVLILALIVGIIHLNMGLVIGAYNNITRGAIKDALGTQINWFFLEAGIAAFAVVYLLYGSIMTAGIVGGPLVLIGLILLIYCNGAFGMMDLTGMLGNVLSYARLLALCLSTGGIAMTVNILAGLCGSMIPVIGIILMPIIFILGQIANGAFQTLGAFINSLRLHYVEFFAQFYIGGSQKFRAFRAKRKYTYIRR